MYSGTREPQAPKVNHTGLTPVKFLGINLTADQMEQRTGYKPETEPEYKSGVDNYGNNYQSAHIFLQDTQSGNTFRLMYNIGDKPAISMAGNYQVITSEGQITWAGRKVEGEVVIQPQFVDHRGLARGEAELIQFVQKLISFDTRSGENWMGQMESNGQTAADLFKGKLKGFDNLYKWADQQGLVILMPLTVRENDGKFYQSASNNPKAWFAGKEVSEYHVKKLQEIEEKETSNAGGKSLFGTDYFTYEYQVFDKATSLGGVPTNPGSTW